MDILYIINGPSMQLRYSLRSIDKYGKNIDRVFICGPTKKPDFLSNIIYIEHPDDYPGEYKQKNILSSIEYTVLNTDISENFLYSSDDHFYIKETDFNNLPYYYRHNSLNNYSQNNKWTKSMYDTYLLLNKYNLPYYNFSEHCNTHMFKSIFFEFKDIIHESYTLENGCEPTSIILNCALSKNMFYPTYRKDIKIKNNSFNKYKISNEECISTNDLEFIGKTGDYLYNEFNNYKSKYEDFNNKSFLRIKKYF